MIEGEVGRVEGGWTGKFFGFEGRHKTLIRGSVIIFVDGGEVGGVG